MSWGFPEPGSACLAHSCHSLLRIGWCWAVGKFSRHPIWVGWDWWSVLRWDGSAVSMSCGCRCEACGRCSEADVWSGFGETNRTFRERGEVTWDPVWTSRFLAPSSLLRLCRLRGFLKPTLSISEGLVQLLRQFHLNVLIQPAPFHLDWPGLPDMGFQAKHCALAQDSAIGGQVHGDGVRQGRRRSVLVQPRLALAVAWIRKGWE